MTSTPCPFCGSPDTILTNIPVIYFNDRNFSWQSCIRCRLLFILPFLSPNDLSLLYGNNYHEKYYFNYTEDYSTQMKILKEYHGKKVLDYGCGDAGFLKACSGELCETTGVEYDSALVTKLQIAFPTTRFLTTETFWTSDPNSYDIIHLGDVLEHMNEPAKMIEKLSEKLSPGGYFFIEGPLERNKNLAYFFRSITFAIKKTIDPNKVRVREPYHVSFATAANQKLLFERSGLTCVRFQTSEVGWPYIDQFNQITSSWLFSQWVISKISIGVSSLIPGWGNRFTYIGKRKASN